ncbi:MAG TPA: hypothetical protein VHS78_03855 [Candidatus Elarobacter sp.]|jgi:hypothetical protein|nr:hypothetical protein [Candidatus Elarobacter sp.]
MIALHRSGRTVIAVAAFASFAGAYLTTPLAARGAAGALPTVTPLGTPLPSPTAFAFVLPRRDPFAGEPSAAGASSHAQSAGTQSLAATQAQRSIQRTTAATAPDSPTAQIPAGLVPLPPNLGASNLSPPFAAPVARLQPTARVIAVVTGSHPFALIDEGGTTRLVTLGDRVGDDVVRAISAAGIRLANGATLRLASDPPPATPAHGAH